MTTKFMTFLLFTIFALNMGNAQDWKTDFNVAKVLAKKENKTLILVFQGSDWCAPCIKLDREVWSTDVFKKYAKEHYVMVQADFPRKKGNALPEAQKASNAKLAEKYNQRGVFPFVVVMDHEGNVLGETSYKKTTPEKYIAILNSFTD
ncbi:thioredoxin family protein [Maribacter algicola]|uniref:Thioredoxin family protein n=1 Tax=Meishania litoralis TaxID=3434685 RepID=A0ACC7LHY1_9FLAO